jgi:hypothetical protein
MRFQELLLHPAFERSGQCFELVVSLRKLPPLLPERFPGSFRD